MIQNIHKKLILRLLAAWLSLSILMGGVVFYLEIGKVDRFVGRMAAEESKGFIKVMSDYLKSPDEANHAQLVQEGRKHILKEHFVMVELFDNNKQKIVEVHHSERHAIEDKISKHGLKLFMDNHVHDEKFYGRDGHIYVLVLTPLKTASGAITGYFNGIYKVPAETMADIKNRIAFSLIQVVLIVFLTAAVIYPIVLALNQGLIRLAVGLSHANIGMLKVLGEAIAKRDSDTNIHNYRVTIYAVRLAQEAGMKDSDIQDLIKGAFLHDVGKIAISDAILLKPGKLSEAEFAVMKTHVDHGIDIIDRYEWLKNAADVVRYHHEKFNGAGYGAGLKGFEIPLSARIFAIADVFDALTSERPYKKAFSLAEALEMMERDNGKHFDPDLFDTFKNIAANLYSEVSAADGGKLENILDQVIKRYFSG